MREIKMEEHNWVISLSNKVSFGISNRMRDRIEEAISEGITWVKISNFLININHIVAIYKEKDNK